MNTWKPDDIKELRRGFKLSQNKLGKLLGVTEDYVYLLERGLRTPSKTLCLLLDCVSERLGKGGEVNNG